MGRTTKKNIIKLLRDVTKNIRNRKLRDAVRSDTRTPQQIGSSASHRHQFIIVVTKKLVMTKSEKDFQQFKAAIDNMKWNQTEVESRIKNQGRRRSNHRQSRITFDQMRERAQSANRG